MKIEVPTLIKTIEDQKFVTKTKRVRKTTFARDYKAAFKPLVTFVQRAVQNDQVAQANLEVMSTKAVFSLETCVINLPFSSVRPLKRVVGNQKQPLPVNVYIMLADPMVDRSKFRIDELAGADDFVKSTASVLTKVDSWVKAQVKKIQYNQAQAAKVPKATRKAQNKRKTTRKRRPRRRYHRKRK